MLNTEINEFAAQTNLTQVASYFDIVDNVVKTGDTNKKYTISTNACNAASAPFKIGSWTSVVISPQGDNMCDLYNSFITADLIVNWSIDSTCSCPKNLKEPIKGQLVWIGFKDAMDAVEQYQLIANGQTFYTQSNAIEESYITSLATPEAVKKVDCYSKVRHVDVWKNKVNSMMGEYVDVSKEKSGTIHLQLKIDIRRFLPLNTIKLIPAFCGNMEIRLKFGVEGLVCAPIGFEYMLNRRFDLLSLVRSNIRYTNCFTPVGIPFRLPTTIETQGTVVGGEGEDKNLIGVVTRCEATIGRRIITVTDSSIDSCFTHLCCFGLDDNLYQGLVQRYTNESLSFPVQTLSFQTMGGVPDANGCDLVLTSTPRFVDTIFLMMQKSQEYKTCYMNPLFKSFTLKMGGYGTIPDTTYDTSSPAFYEMVSNAYNTNNDAVGFNTDVMKSLVHYEAAVIDPDTKQYLETNPSRVITYSSEGSESNDVTNFVFGFPVSTDFTFQQGQTSNTPITYNLKAHFDPDTRSSYVNDKACISMMGFLKDSVLAIQLRPAGPPIVALDEYDVTSPMN